MARGEPAQGGAPRGLGAGGRPGGGMRGAQPGPRPGAGPGFSSPPNRSQGGGGGGGGAWAWSPALRPLHPHLPTLSGVTASREWRLRAQGSGGPRCGDRGGRCGPRGPRSITSSSPPGARPPERACAGAAGGVRREAPALSAELCLPRGSLGPRRSRSAAAAEARRGRRSGCGAGRPGAPLPRHGSRSGRGDRARAGGGGRSRGSGGGGGRGGLRTGGRLGAGAPRSARPGPAPAP